MFFIVIYSENNWKLRASQKTEKLSHEEDGHFYITKVPGCKLKYCFQLTSIGCLKQVSMMDCLTEGKSQCENSFALLTCLGFLGI